MVIFNTIESIFSIVLIIMLGYYCTVRGWLNQPLGNQFSWIITNLTLPAYMIWNLMTTFSKDLLLHLAPGLAVPFLSILVCYISGYGISRLLKVSPQHQGTFCAMFSLSNSVFIGLPVNLALFGEESMPYVLLYYIANTTFFWTLGTGGIRRDGALHQAGESLGEVLKKVFSPPLLGFAFSILLVLSGVRLPHFVLDACKYLGSMTTPLSMLFIGIAICGVKLSGVRLNGEMIMVIMGRFVISPLLVMALTYFLPLPVLLKKVFIIQSSLPVMTLTAVVARSYQADAAYAAVMTTVTTIMALVTIPIYMLIFQYYF